MPFQLSYNTQNPKILFREYGRNIQEMVEYALSIEDLSKRSRVAQGIVQTMSELLPAQNKKTEEFQHKLWDHLHIMANFALEVDSPFQKPAPEEQHHKIQHIAYPQLHYKNRHYGSHVQALIQHAIAMNEGEQKISMIRTIAHYMKMVHKNLKNEIASEETIRNDLRSLSKGQLDIIFTAENILVLEADPPKKKHKRPNNQNNHQRSQNQNNHQNQIVSPTHKQSEKSTNQPAPIMSQQQQTTPTTNTNNSPKRKRNRNRRKSNKS